MFKKFLLGALTLLLALTLVGCGGKKDAGDAKKDDAAQKTEVAAPEATPDKAILAYAQLYAYGTPDEDAINAAGLTEKEIKDVQQLVIGGPMFGFSEYLLSKENLESIVNQYTEKLKASTNVKTTVKKDDKENPVVELTATTIDNEAAAKMYETNTDLTGLNKAMEELKAQGLTDEQLVGSAEYQAFAIEALDKVIDAMPFNSESSIEVPCVIVEKDGKNYWAPQDVTVIDNFIWSKK